MQFIPGIVSSSVTERFTCVYSLELYIYISDVYLIIYLNTLMKYQAFMEDK